MSLNKGGCLEQVHVTKKHSLKVIFKTFKVGTMSKKNHGLKVIFKPYKGLYHFMRLLLETCSRCPPGQSGLWMGLEDHSKTFLFLAFICWSLPSWLKVRGEMSRRLCGE